MTSATSSARSSQPLLAAIRHKFTIVALQLSLPLLLAAPASAYIGNREPNSDAARLRAALEHGTVPSKPLDFSTLAPAASTPASEKPLEGELVLTPSREEGRMEVLRDQFGYVTDNSALALARQTLPTMRIKMVEQDGELLPLQRGIVVTDNPAWDYLVEPGAIWRSSTVPGYRQVSLPFALMERNANCLHNGILRFQLDDANNPSAVYFQISSETCAYFQFNLHGTASATWQSQQLATATTVRSDRVRERQQRLPTDSLTALARRYPQTDVMAFSGQRDFRVANRTLAGVVIDGVHYRTDCDTRHGRYPFCEALLLPSYSTAKSVVAGLALMRLQKQSPGIASALIADYVPECRALPQWQGVSFGHALDMATGNYLSATADADESAGHFGQFIGAERHADKIRYACQQFPRKAEPGTRMVYHSSDTYLLGAAMQAWLKQHDGPDRDLYRDVLVEPLFKPLQLSPAMAVTRRTRDEYQQPFTSFGLVYLPDDVAKLLRFLGPDQGKLNGVRPFDDTMFAEAMQQRFAQQSLSAGIAGVRYENGFWAVDVANMIGCRQPLYVPTLSGYGGISWVLFPNGIGYYYFSDGNEFRWQQAARAAHQIRSMCS